MKSRGPYRRHSTPFELQLCQNIRNGVIGRRDAQRTYGVSANLIQLWLTQFDRGELNDEEAEASVIAEYEAHNHKRVARVMRANGKLLFHLISLLRAGKQETVLHATQTGFADVTAALKPCLGYAKLNRTEFAGDPNS